MRRATTLFAATLWCLAVVAPTCAAESNSPKALVFTVQCAGGLTFELTAFNNSSRVGLVNGGTTTANLVSGTSTVSVNGNLLYTQEFSSRPGLGLETITCDAQASFVNANGNLVTIALVDAEFQLSGAR